MGAAVKDGAGRVGQVREPCNGFLLCSSMRSSGAAVPVAQLSAVEMCRGSIARGSIDLSVFRTNSPPGGQYDACGSCRGSAALASRSVMRYVLSSNSAQTTKFVLVGDRDPLAVHALRLDQTATVPAVQRDERHVELARKIGEPPLGRIVAERCLRAAWHESVSPQHHVDESLVEAVPLSGRDPPFGIELFCDATRRESIPAKLVDPRHQFVVSLELIELADGPTETRARFV